MKIRILFVVILIATAYMLSAQQMPADSSTLDEVVIAANRTAERKASVAQQVHVITQAAIRQRNPMSTADLLHDSGQLLVQRSQQGGGSPMIRGYEASRILLVVDGVRMNNLIYRSGHLQNVITVDPNILDRVEVLSGPGSTMYGSDAMGGVIHLATRKPKFSLGDRLELSGAVSAGYQSANQGMRFHMSANAGTQNFASLSAITLNRFGDLRMGGSANPFYAGSYFGERPVYQDRVNGQDVLVQNKNKLVQKYSGYDQMDLMQKFLWALSSTWQHAVNLQFSTSANVPRYDRLTDPKGSGMNSAQWYYGPQKRLLAIYSLVHTSDGFFKRYEMAASFQKVEESRHNRGFGSVRLNHRVEDVTVAGWQLSAHRVQGCHDLRAGTEIYWNGLKSTARQENIATGESVPLDTRYPDGTNVSLNASAYVTHTWKINSRFTLNDGIRLGFNSLRSTFRDKTFFPFPFDNVRQNNPVYSGNLGLIWRSGGLRIAALTSLGFRTPNVDDLSKVFESTPGRLIVPNPSLGPETSWSKEVSFGYYGRTFTFENVVYHSNLFNFISLAPGTLEGKEFVDYNDSLSRVYTSVNLARGYIYGYSGQATYQLPGHFSVNGSLNYTYGRSVTESGGKVPLDHIPPVIIRAGAGYKVERLEASVYVLANGRKKITDYSPSGEDNAQYAPATGMPAWMTLNARATYSMTGSLKIQAGIENLLDVQHRYFASGINAPGRNIWINVSLNW